MSAADWQSDGTTAAERLQRIRVGGGVSFALAPTGGATRPLRVAEADGHRVRFPDCGRTCEAVLLNTGGGIVGGDRVRFGIELAAHANAVVTSVAAERIYRASGRAAEIDIALALASGTRLAWLPQETILYAASRLERRVSIELAPSAELTFLDMLVLGRRGSGERMTSGFVSDRWSVRRGRRLIHMEALGLNGAIADKLERPAITGGGHVIATLLHVSEAASDRLEPVRATLAERLARFRSDEDVPDVAASAWSGKLVVRALGGKLSAVRDIMAALAPVLTGAPLPRSWQL